MVSCIVWTNEMFLKTLIISEDHNSPRDLWSTVARLLGRGRYVCDGVSAKGHFRCRPTHAMSDATFQPFVGHRLLTRFFQELVRYVDSEDVGSG